MCVDPGFRILGLTRDSCFSSEPPGSQTESGATATPVNEFEGVDPSFLAALPDDIRQEVIRCAGPELGYRKIFIFSKSD